MSIHAQNTTAIALGMAHQVDAFQGGREAAYTAKRQLNDAPANLALAFGPGDVHFQSFIEGVRLVTGEDALVGIPSPQIVTHNVFEPELSMVILLQMAETKISLATLSNNNTPNAIATTSLLTQLRQQHGHQTRQYRHRMLVLIDNLGPNPESQFPQSVRFESGLTTNLISVKTCEMNNVPLMMQDKLVFQGLVALEFLTNSDWGIAGINIGEFTSQKKIYSEAAKTILKRAVNQMSTKPSGGLIMSNCSPDHFSTEQWASIFQAVDAVVPGIPVVGILTRQIFFHLQEQPNAFNKEALAVILLP